MKRVALIGCAVALGAAGCASPQYQARRSEVNSALTGAVVGGTLGGIIGNNVGDRENDVLGAAIGAATGAWLGQQYGQQQDMIRHRLEALESAHQAETIMISNSNGSFMPVTLTKVGYGQYRGPRGEIYPSRPTEEQLRAAYGF
ncbi:MAG: glycine zipper domain-containing protein [Kiritimatiellae bacterium]|nr:glycine zipper domain-containing protein [Kiritimatiellia bacterium]MDW8458837.1 glycine zipper domain-containing protein [Verrucomicrobiota bacterium]